MILSISARNPHDGDVVHSHESRDDHTNELIPDREPRNDQWHPLINSERVEIESRPRVNTQSADAACKVGERSVVG